jgi:hypothetical protein
MRSHARFTDLHLASQLPSQPRPRPNLSAITCVWVGGAASARVSFKVPAPDVAFRAPRCPGELTMTLEHTRAAGGLLRAAPPVTVYYALISNEPAGNGVALNLHSSQGGGSEADAGANGRMWESGQAHALDWRSRLVSYKSLGCSSFASNDVGDPSTLECGPVPPDSPTARCVSSQGNVAAAGAGPGSLGALAAPPAPAGTQTPPRQQQLVVQAGPLPPLQSRQIGGGVVVPVAPNRFEPVQEADESGTVSPARSTLHDAMELSPKAT